MSSRQTARPHHAASALKARGFHSGKDVRSFSKSSPSTSSSEPNMVSSWWRENGRQYTAVFGLGSVLALYGITFYLKSLGHQPVQLVVSTSLLSISLLNVHNYLTSTARRTIQNSIRVSSILPSNVYQNPNGSYVVAYWKPSKYSETVFLNYNPLIPVLGYIWVRSFEPLAGFLCLFLMGFSTVLLHIMVTKMRSMVQNELLMHSETPKPSALVATEVPPPSAPTTAPRSNSPDFSIENPVDMQFRNPPLQRRDMPPSSIFQVPTMSNPSSVPIDDLASQVSPTSFEEYMDADTPSFAEQMHPLHRSPPKSSSSDPYSPPRVHLQGPALNLSPAAHAGISLHAHQPKQPIKTPQRTPFGRRLGAGALQDDPSTPSQFHDSSASQEFRPFARAPTAQHQAPYAPPPMGGAAPPRFSIQEFQ